MNPNEQCRLCNCSFKVKFGSSNISTENLLNPFKRKDCKGEISAQNLGECFFCRGKKQTVFSVYNVCLEAVR